MKKFNKVVFHFSKCLSTRSTKQSLRETVLKCLTPLSLVLLVCGCERDEFKKSMSSSSSLQLEEMAKIMSSLPLEKEHLQEVFDAVEASSNNGYDEEYMMSDLLSCPGAGVGDAKSKATTKREYTKPLRELLSEHLSARAATKAGGAEDVEAYLKSLSESDLQIYWPYSELWDGDSFPIITFDPGNEAESNIAYVLEPNVHSLSDLKTVLVDEEMAKGRPVWVINRNDDAMYTPIQEYCPDIPDLKSVSSKASDAEEDCKSLYLRTFRMNQHFDSWFGGASEFFVKCGAINGFRATNDEDLRLYRPDVTDIMIVVKRNQLGMSIPLDALLISDFTEQMEKIAFLVIEDDGGETKSWKCSLVVKLKSKSTGIELEIPYKDRDDIVWRGQLAHSFFADKAVTNSNFGGVSIRFEQR